jgi:hypothetical protein
MTDFEDGLWSELVREHGAELLHLGPRPRNRSRRAWRAPLAAGAVAVTGVIVAAALTITASNSPPAYALVVHANGTVTLTINELVGISPVNAQLARLGVRARVARVEPGCTAEGHFIRTRLHLHPKSGLPVEPEKLRPGLGGIRMVIHPSEIPPGDTLLLTARRMDGTHDGAPFQALGMSMGLYRGPAPACRR